MRAACSSVSMSARRNWRAWKSLSAWPKAWRSRGVGEGAVEGGLGAAEGGGGDVEPAAVEAGHGVAEACALVAEQVVGRDAAVVELDLGGGLGLPAHLALRRAEAEAGGSGLDQHGRDAARAVAAGADHDEVEVGEAAAGDEGLGAVQGPAVVGAGRRGCAARRRPSRSRARSGSRRRCVSIGDDRGR